MSERTELIKNAFGFTGLCRYYASISIYIGWRRIREAANRARYWIASKNDLKTRLFTGETFHLPKGDAGIGAELMSGIREPNATRYLMTHLEADEVIVDIGANIGYYVAVERHASPGAEIHAVEPVEANRGILRANAPKEVQIYSYAISDHIGTSSIYVPDHCNWATLNRQHAETLAKVHEEQVPVTTLDQFCVDHDITPTFVRMDTEGSEIEIIKSARHLIESDLPLKLMIELHAPARQSGEVEEMICYLLDNGFEIQQVIAESNEDSCFVGAALADIWYKMLWQSIPGTTYDRLTKITQWGFCPNVFLVRSEK